MMKTNDETAERKTVPEAPRSTDAAEREHWRQFGEEVYQYGILMGYIHCEAVGQPTLTQKFHKATTMAAGMALGAPDVAELAAGIAGKDREDPERFIAAFVREVLASPRYDIQHLVEIAESMGRDLGAPEHWVLGIHAIRWWYRVPTTD